MKKINQIHSINSVFTPETKDRKIRESALVYAFVGAKVLLFDCSIPSYKTIQRYNLDFRGVRYIGKLHNKGCYALEIIQNEEAITCGTLIDLRKLYTILPEQHLRAAIYAFQIILWDNNTLYCGHCGFKTIEVFQNILVKECPKCKKEYYPKISPAVIVSVINKDKILLARHKEHTNDAYTVLAGFVSPGETLEDCIHREIKEEAGIEVKNIRYFRSQVWPFPDLLMIGFIADYDKGLLKPDNVEIADLKWFASKEIPEWSDKSSLARLLIDNFINAN